MTIQEISERCKAVFANDSVFVPTVIVLVGFSAFALGRLSTIERPKVNIIGGEQAKNMQQMSHISENQPASSAGIIEQKKGSYVASKNGSVYHLPWCSGVSRMKEENKVWFDSKEDAENAGYRPAANCPGI